MLFHASTSGLDPAQPRYHNFSTDVRLDSSDANFVDVIHTDAIPYGTIGGKNTIISLLILKH